jgi:hypothetical protein
MKMNRIGIVFVMLIALAGCGGGGAKVTNTTVSEGQELIDLKKAYDTGALTKQEYERDRKKILRRRN